MQRHRIAIIGAGMAFEPMREFAGTRATAVLTGARLEVHHRDGRSETLGSQSSTGGGADPMAFSHEAHRAVLAEFLDALDSARAPQNDGRSALAVLDLIDALQESARRGAPMAFARDDAY